MFGKFIKEKRIERSLSLREFCRKLNEDASNWSKVEREIMPPPKDSGKLAKIAGVLKIEKGTADWDALHDFASVDSGRIPEYIMTDKDALRMLPIFFRTIGSEKPTEKEIKEFIMNTKKNG
jgi:transcriptional regulator with XRE-family HTH domain